MRQIRHLLEKEERSVESHRFGVWEVSGCFWDFISLGSCVGSRAEVLFPADSLDWILEKGSLEITYSWMLYIYIYIYSDG